MKSVRIWAFSGPYLYRMQENTDQENSEYGNFSRSQTTCVKVIYSGILGGTSKNQQFCFFCRAPCAKHFQNVKVS